MKSYFDSHHDIYTVNIVYKPEINILTEIENRSSLLLQVGELQRIVRHAPPFHITCCDFLNCSKYQREHLKVF